MRALGDLSLALVTSPRVEGSVRAFVRRVAGSVEEALERGTVDLVLVEPGLEGAAHLAEAARRHRVPCAGWLRGTLGAEAEDALRACDALFVADPALAEPVERLTGRRPAPLPDAASSEALAATRRVPAEPWIAVAAGDQDDSGFARLLAAADERKRRDVPADPRAAADMLARCTALLAGHAAGASQLHVPGAVFDAVAMRTPVVMPANRGAALLLPGIVPRAVGPRHAAELVAAAVQQGRAPAVGGVTVRNGHTYGHRLATIASALGLRTLPGRPPADHAEG